MTLTLALAILILTATARATAPALTTLIAEAQVSLWTCQDQLQQPRTRYSVSPYALPRSHAYREWTLNLWTQRRTACLTALHEQARQWNWQAFLPANWRNVARCETGIDWTFANGVYVSAFGISRREYDRDAAYMDAPPWNDARPPSPWNQYQAALGHYRRFGDGWGCPGP
jgi:hypothetical protein